MLLARGSVAASMVAPEDPASIYLVANAEFRNRGGEISPQTAAAVARAARWTPLADEPFAFAGNAASTADPARALQLLEEARRRNPRNRAVRLMLIDHYIRRNMVEAAAAEIKVVSRLEASVGGLLVEPLARLALDPGTRRTLRLALGNDPLVDAVLAALVRRNADAGIILELAAPRMAAYSPANPPDWQQLLIDSRVGQGRYSEARALWSRFARVEAAPGGVYNPRFARVRGMPPFNWRLTADAAGVAEPDRDGGIEIVYFGRGDAELAAQLVPVRPGNHQLRTRAVAVDQGRGSHLAWRVSCAAGNARLAELSLDRLTRQPALAQIAFTVPASCPAVWVKLIGEAGEFPARREIRVEEIQIVPGGSS